ncbi:DUF433 domain-containing protein [Ferroglobus sp.]|uniref:DUF433 domain-containing protein n=1 Tax=Ferroglobus sp. TaxID=2614230 RepID=UPI0025BEA791|nr:DUF433 domain-containing protein [Ferroglobus sp.]
MEIKIIQDPEIRFGKPVIKGTRISVYDILEALKSGWTIDEIAEEFNIPREAVIKSIEFIEEKLKEITLIKV